MGRVRTMAVSLEKCENQAYVLRMGSEHQKFGDPYTAAGTVEIDGEVAIVKGFISTSPLVLEDFTVIRHAFKNMGIKSIKIERRKEQINKTTIHEWVL